MSPFYDNRSSPGVRLSVAKKGRRHDGIRNPESSITKMATRVLDGLGYHVTEQVNSTKALELFQTQPEAFDLVVTDMAMPELTGDKLSVELMKIRPEIPVILITGYSEKISPKRAAELGIKALTLKPLVHDNLAKTVRKVLDDSQHTETILNA